MTVVSLTLEAIVQVRMAPMEQLHKTGDNIEREEKQAPALVLSNVNVLVRTKAAKYRVISANYHVAKGNRDKPSGSRKKRNDPSELPACDFNHAVDKTDCRPSAQCDGSEQQADSGGGQRPHVTHYEVNLAHRFER